MKTKIEIQDKFVVVATIVRPVVDGENVLQSDGTVVRIDNRRGNYFFINVCGKNVLACLDTMTDREWAMRRRFAKDLGVST